MFDVTIILFPSVSLSYLLIPNFTLLLFLRSRVIGTDFGLGVGALRSSVLLRGLLAKASPNLVSHSLSLKSAIFLINYPVLGKVD